MERAGAGAAVLVLSVVVVCARIEEDMKVVIREKVIILNIADCFGE
jgi:hypothetical protein